MWVKCCAVAARLVSRGRWSHDGKYFAKMAEDAIQVYSTEDFKLLDKSEEDEVEEMQDIPKFADSDSDDDDTRMVMDALNDRRWTLHKQRRATRTATKPVIEKASDQ